MKNLINEYVESMLEDVGNLADEYEFDRVWEVWYDKLCNEISCGDIIDKISSKFYDNLESEWF